MAEEVVIDIQSKNSPPCVLETLLLIPLHPPQEPLPLVSTLGHGCAINIMVIYSRASRTTVQTVPVATVGKCSVGAGAPNWHCQLGCRSKLAMLTALRFVRARRCGAEKWLRTCSRTSRSPLGEAENDKGYETTSWTDIVDSRDSLGTLTIESDFELYKFHPKSVIMAKIFFAARPNHGGPRSLVGMP